MVSLSEMACPFTVRHQMITVVTKEKILNEIPLKNGPAEFECFTQSFAFGIAPGISVTLNQKYQIKNNLFFIVQFFLSAHLVSI